jgi:hypothetical protein
MGHWIHVCTKANIGARSHHLGWMKTTKKTVHQMHLRRGVSKVSAPIPPSTPDRKQQQRRTRQFCYCNRGAAAMECAMTWLGNNRMMQPVTWNSNNTDDDALRYQANAPPHPVTPLLPDPTVVTTRTTRPNRSSRFTNGHGSVDRRTHPLQLSLLAPNSPQRPP